MTAASLPADERSRRSGPVPAGRLLVQVFECEPPGGGSE